MKKSLPILLIILLLVVSGVLWLLARKNAPQPIITTFEECAAAGYPILESYPEQCRTPDGKSFTKVVTASGTEFGSPVILRLNEEAKFSDGLTVTLVAINDSRCKTGVVCIWAGELAYQVKLLGGSINKETEIKLGTVTTKSVTQSGYILTLDKADENSLTITVTTESDTFDKTGLETMEICNAKAICHQGAVIFEAGEVISITDVDGAEVGVEFSQCDAESCYVEDVSGREWDLVWIVETPKKAPTTICTQDAKLCPDGSYVSRTGPNCEFTACPTASATQ